ncbi:M15 family metallopeptidase [Cytobacillus praedii]|uniref:M15 family metallopeptidase n=1 Tax=Cytobacillus praedii TaxID=1742358 RepID=UPI002E23DCD5|nr:M15 family metallopeptidase [Cytobacillus praedii]
MSVTSACRDINELHSVAQVACKLFLEECKKAGLDIFITETYRSQERQDYLYSQGRSRPGKIVTWTLKSNHKSRLAWDIACNKPSLYDAATLKKAGLIAMNLGIGWGGVWKTPDMPHFEVTTNWKVDDEKMTLEEKFKPIEQKNLTEGQQNMLKRLAKIGAIAEDYKPSQIDLVWMSGIDSAFKNSGFYEFAKK